MVRLKNFKVMVIIVLYLFVTGCGLYYPNSVLAEPTRYSAWIAYWDMAAGEQELAKVKGKLHTVSRFAAYFDKNNEIFVPAQIIEQKARNKKVNYKTYLTFVNDKQLSESNILLKDIGVLEAVFASDETMQAHIDEIISVTQKYGFDGIEIDYEHIWSNSWVGKRFNIFINKLSYNAIKSNLGLRVVLEPGIPFGETDFARGPAYVVMLYNLYGTHSGPGPKADKRFIERTISKMSSLPEGTAVALSNGGCIWGDDGTKRFITQEDAELFIKRHKPKKVERDANSGALHFEYESFGKKYVVWYADVETLNEWVKTSKLMGVADVFIWRLGGNKNLNKLI